MSKKRTLVYVSGPMSKYADQDHNYSAFNRAAAHLRELGYEVLNPAETAGGTIHLPRETFLSIDLGYVQATDVLVLLPEWQDSMGSKLELLTAVSLGKPAFLYNKADGLGPRVELHDMAPTYELRPTWSRFDRGIV